ncbi:MAG: glycoside hydrolase family 13 protein [Lachnospiraceae bacterium]|nr:glycoside hydrolase family 13 protein [Lachnospiraceae bacterium]
MNLGFQDKSDGDQWYVQSMRPVFSRRAVFSDTSENFISPAEPNPYDKVTIKLRTAKHNVDKVSLVTHDSEIRMQVVESDRYFDYYACEITMPDREFYYYFRLKVGRLVCVYDAIGVQKSVSSQNPFKIVPGFHTPEWAKGAVMYQIFTERFCNSDPSNDVVDGEYFYVGGLVKKIDDWYQLPAPDDTKEFYGGDLQGVIDKLGYLKDLGIDAIYFNPLFVSPSNHKYDSQDYEHIDPHFGKIVKDGGECLHDTDRDNKHATKYQIRVSSLENLQASDDLFCELVKKAHELGIKIVLDGVFNHCGSFNKWLDRERIYEESADFEKGAFISEDSPYRDFFDFRNKEGWPYNASYDGWWGYDTLPKLNYEASKDLYDKVIEIGRKWVSEPFCVDGWRLDVAADLGHSPEFNHEFYKRFRANVKEANPEALILAEHYGDPGAWLNGKEWDSVMNYDAFMEPVTWFLTGMQKHSDEFRGDLLGNAKSFFDTMVYCGNRMATASKLVAMNQLSNHDHSRFLTRTNQKVGRVSNLGPKAAEEGVDKAVMRLGVMMQMTWVGAPTIYYGDEAGLCGFTDPDNRRTFPWGREDHELIRFHKEMIRIHKENRCLITGSVKNLVEEEYLIAYGRFTKDEAIIVVINRDNNERYVKIPAWETAGCEDLAFEKIMISSRDGFSSDVYDVEVENGKLKVNVPGVSGIVYRRKKKN